jgi:hypothetical protein
MQALGRKIERGHTRDLADVTAMVRTGEVDPERWHQRRCFSSQTRALSASGADMIPDLRALPGGDLIMKGLADLRSATNDSIEALTSGRSRRASGRNEAGWRQSSATRLNGAKANRGCVFCVKSKRGNLLICLTACSHCM